MKRALGLLWLLATVASVHAAQLKIFFGPTFSAYTGRWPSEIFPNPMGRSGGLNPFKNGRTGSLEGIELEFRLNPWLGMEIGGIYFTAGSSFSAPTAIFTVQKETYDMEGLSLPVLFTLKPHPGLFPYLLAGIDFAFILNHTRTSLVLPETAVIYREIAREDLRLATRKFDLAPVLGVGFEIAVLKQTFFAEAQYRLGLMNMVKGFPGTGAAARTRSLFFIVGYRM